MNGKDKTGNTPSSITPLAPHRARLRFAGLAEMESYWQALRGGREVPNRSDIDPRGIEQTLDFAFIVERVAPGVARFRLAGNYLSDLMGMDVRGMPMTTFFTAATRSTMCDAIEAVFAGPEILEVPLVSEKSIGKPRLEAQLLMLPLKSDLGDISRAIGCLSVQGKSGRAPRRFDLNGAVKRRLVNPSLETPEGKTREQAFAERKAAFRAKRLADTQAQIKQLRARRSTEQSTERSTDQSSPQSDPSHPSERPYLRLITD